MAMQFSAYMSSKYGELGEDPKCPLSWIRWCDDQKLVLPPKAAADDATHFTLNGHKLKVPWDKNETFLEKYAQCLASKQVMFAIERRAPHFVMHFDLDFVQPAEVTHAEVAVLVTMFQATFAAYYPSVNSSSSPDSSAATVFRAIVLSSDSKPARGSDGSPCIKTGFHVMFPALVVTAEEALLLRAGCVAAYRKQLSGDRPPPANSVEDVLDESVLRPGGNGLRMVGSHKCAKCVKCLAIKARDYKCPQCEGTRHVDEGRPYYPVFTQDGRGRPTPSDLARIRQNFIYMVQQCSVRTPHTQSSHEIVPPPGAPMPAAGHRPMRTEPRRDEGRDLRFDGGEFKDSRVGAKYTVEVERDSELFLQVQTCVRERVHHEMYRDVELSRVFCNAERSYYLCKLRAHCPGGNWCMNVGRNHTSAQIYFQIDAKGISQRCFSSKSGPDGGGARCGKWRSLPVALPADVRAALFGAAPGPTVAEQLKAAGGTMDQLTIVRLMLNVVKEAEGKKEDKKLAAGKSGGNLGGNLGGNFGGNSSVAPAPLPRHPLLTHMTIKEVEALGVFELADAVRKHQAAAKAAGSSVAANTFKPMKRREASAAAAGAAKKRQRTDSL